MNTDTLEDHIRGLAAEPRAEKAFVWLDGDSRYLVTVRRYGPEDAGRNLREELKREGGAG